MNSPRQSCAQSITLSVPTQIVKDANALFPQTDIGGLILTLLEKYVRFQKRKLLAQQYQQYYQSLTEEDRTEEKEMLADFAALEAEVNAFIESEEVNGDS